MADAYAEECVAAVNELIYRRRRAIIGVVLFAQDNGLSEAETVEAIGKVEMGFASLTADTIDSFTSARRGAVVAEPENHRAPHLHLVPSGGGSEASSAAASGPTLSHNARIHDWDADGPA